MICENCGKTFPKNGKQRYCSRKCMLQAWHKRNYVPVANEPVKCKECGELFIPTKKDQLYCSPKCQRKEWYAQNRKIKRYCVICGSEIIDMANASKYCSDECREKAHIKICQECGKEYLPSYTEQKYCSSECSANAQKDKKLYVCKQCGKEFHRRKRNEDQCLFCSRKCASEFLLAHLVNVYPENGSSDAKRRYRIRKNGNPDFSINLRLLYERDKGICAICGESVDMTVDPLSDEYGSIDHIVPLAKGGKHRWDNVQLAHRICNSRKGIK